MTESRGEWRGPAPLLASRLSTHSSHLESSRTQPQHWSRPRVFAAGATLSAAAIVVGLLGTVSGGWPSRIDPTVLALDAAQLDYNQERPRCHGDDRHAIPYRDTCRFGAPTVAPRYAVWGDSHAAELSVALGEVAERVGEAVRMMSYSGCPPALPVAGAARTPGCLAHNAAMLEGVRSDAALETVFLIARYSQARDELGDVYFDRLGAVARELVDAGKRVAIVYPSPEYPYVVPVQLARAAHRAERLESLGLPRAAFEASRAPFTAALDRIRAKGRIEKVDPAARLCDETRCHIYAEGHALYFDDDHLSLAGARYLAPLFAPWFDLPATAFVANQ